MEQSNSGLAWFEIPVSDMDRAIGFYEEIYKIKMQKLNLGALTMAIFPGWKNGGALCQHESYRPSQEGVVIYLYAESDLNTVLSRVESAGGKVLAEKKLIAPGQGYMALFLDSEGNRLALRSSQ
jgi:predicted enzyme related to lactoylglutathione lyase